MKKINQWIKDARSVCDSRNVDSEFVGPKGRLGHPRLRLTHRGTGKVRHLPLPRSPGGGGGGGRGYPNFMRDLKNLVKEIEK